MHRSSLPASRAVSSTGKFLNIIVSDFTNVWTASSPLSELTKEWVKSLPEKAQLIILPYHSTSRRRATWAPGSHNRNAHTPWLPQYPTNKESYLPSGQFPPITFTSLSWIPIPSHPICKHHYACQCSDSVNHSS